MFLVIYSVLLIFLFENSPFGISVFPWTSHFIMKWSSFWSTTSGFSIINCLNMVSFLFSISLPPLSFFHFSLDLKCSLPHFIRLVFLLFSLKISVLNKDLSPYLSMNVFSLLFLILFHWHFVYVCCLHFIKLSLLFLCCGEMEFIRFNNWGCRWYLERDEFVKLV